MAASPLDPVLKLAGRTPVPVPLVLYCPDCGLQHVDEPGDPVHWSHQCLGCRYVWRPSDAPTQGVASIRTRGEGDSPRLARAAPAVQPSLSRHELVDPAIARGFGRARASRLKGWTLWLPPGRGQAPWAASTDEC